MELVSENVQNGTNLSQGNSASASDIEQGLGRIRVIETGDGLVMTHFVTARERFYSEYSKFAVKTAQSTVEMCRVVYEAKKSLDKSEYASFLQDIGRKTEDSTIRKYLAIGERYDDLIAYTNLLPASWTSMYEVIQLPAESFMAMVTLGESMANLTGAQIKRLKSVNTSDKTVDSTVPSMPSTTVKKSASAASSTNDSEQSLDNISTDATVDAADGTFAAQKTVSATSDTICADSDDPDRSSDDSLASDNEFAEQATSSLIERVSQNSNLSIKDDDLEVDAKDQPYELIIRFNSRPSDDAAHAIVEALFSVFSKHRVDAEVVRANEQVI
jgi:hypothetical protein